MKAKYILSLLTLSLCAAGCQQGRSGDEDPPTETSSSSSQDSVSEFPKITGFEIQDTLYPLSLWNAFNDNSEGGASQSQYQVFQDSESGNHMLKLTVQLSKQQLPYDPSAGMAFHLDADASPYGGLTYRYRGAAHYLRAEIAEITDYDFHNIKMPASSEWVTITIYWDQLVQEGWGTRVEFSPRNLLTLSWNIKALDGTKDSLFIDDLGWAMPIVVSADFPIRSPGDPGPAEIGDISIAHPLQQRARQYLSQGINLTNWLEENAPFHSFKYEESTVAKLAEFGFKGLRLPIDLDQYVKNKASVLAGTAAFQIDSALFTPLDSFLAWTERYHMSLTIDYHQYDKSFTASSSTFPAYRHMMKALWANIAKRYSDSPRQDLFYELLNEPDNQIDANTWHSLAQEIMDTIRVHDRTRPLIFGGVNWYRIPELTANEPFSDPNIIYVFHFYEPFLYTHQGAPWETDLLGVKKIPFPYSPERWADNYRYFGASAGWVKTLIDNYPDQGNRNAMESLVLQAKRWAVNNNVPLICNEFGANTYQTSSTDRNAWLTAAVDIFEELDIPWQHWGYDSGNDIVDKQKEMLPGIREAFRLP